MEIKVKKINAFTREIEVNVAWEECRDDFQLTAKKFGKKLGLSEKKSYGSWEEMLDKEKKIKTSERLDLVTVATPNSTHFEITKSSL